MITHIIGGAVGLLILIGSILIGAEHRDPWAMVSGSIYGFFTCTLFAVSSVYHGLPDGMGKRVMQVIDHCTIYFMIAAGTIILPLDTCYSIRLNIRGRHTLRIHGNDLVLHIR